MRPELQNQSSQQVSISAVEEINQLHSEILAHARKSLDHAIRIGELLTLAKKTLKHGNWLSWIEDELPFSQPTAWRYMQCFDQRDRLELFKLNNLSQVYVAIASKNGEEDKEPQKLHEPNFHSQAVRLRQNLVALFNHHLQRRPLKVWHTEEVYDLFCSLQPMTEICRQLEMELDTRNDVPSTYRSANRG